MSAIAHWFFGGGRWLTLFGPYGIVWRLNYSPQLTKPYFHPLQTSDGTLLTWVAPPDHPWHYGLWHSWKFIDGVNYWEEDRKTGRPAGTTRIAAAEVLRTDDTGADVRLRLEYHPSVVRTRTWSASGPAVSGAHRPSASDAGSPRR